MMSRSIYSNLLMLAEIKKLCSVNAQSVLQRGDVDTIKSFTWQTLMSELSAYTPVLKRILEAICPKKTQPNFTTVVCVCGALLACSRNRHMSLKDSLSDSLCWTLIEGGRISDNNCVYIVIYTYWPNLNSADI